MTGMWTFIAAIVSFGIAAGLGKVLIPFLRKLKYGQTILGDVEWHKVKQGTPVMGGIMFIISSVVTTVLCVLLYYITSKEGDFPIESSLATIKVFAGLIMAFLYGSIGFIDDYIKVVKKRNLGLTAIQKLVLQFAIAIAYLVTLAMAGDDTSTIIPFVGSVNLGVAYYVIAAVVIVGIVNATNLTDGIDGLCSSVTFFVCIFMMMICSILGVLSMSIMAAAMAGGCIGFLLWNFHPAKVFMGDTGSLYLGGMICALAFGVDLPILLIPMGIIYIAEMFSVILQVSYFKITKGKRLFKMSPIHHHFEKSGWSEVKIGMVFSFVTVITCFLSMAGVYYGV